MPPAGIFGEIRNPFFFAEILPVRSTNPEGPQGLRYVNDAAGVSILKPA